MLAMIRDYVPVPWTEAGTANASGPGDINATPKISWRRASSAIDNRNTSRPSGKLYTFPYRALRMWQDALGAARAALRETRIPDLDSANQNSDRLANLDAYELPMV